MWKIASTLAVIATCTLAGCALRRPPEPPPLRPPGPVYRIDENRYFELSPTQYGTCQGEMVYYVDKTASIRSAVVLWDNMIVGIPYTIDAANRQYLIGPARRGSTNCSSGGGGCSESSLPYSTDSGRTWVRSSAVAAWAPTGISGEIVYSITSVKTINTIDLRSNPNRTTEWTYAPHLRDIPPVVKSPLDKEFTCKFEAANRDDK